MKIKVKRYRQAFCSITELCDHYIEKDPGVDYESLTARILARWPQSAWNRTHFSWHKSRIKKERRVAKQNKLKKGFYKFKKTK